MGNDIIQADYDQLDAIAGRFGGQAEANQQLMAKVRQSMEPLQSGGWQGRGSAAFFAEMNREVLPAVQRMTTALNQARSVTLQVRDVMKAAEEKASRPFRGEAHSGDGSVSAGNGPDGVAAHGNVASGPGGNGSNGIQGGVANDPRAERQETLDILSTIFSIPNIATSAPSLFASGWLKGPFRGQLNSWRKALLPWAVPEAHGLAPSVSDDAAKWFARTTGKTGFADYLANNRALKFLGRGLAVLDAGFSLGKVVNDPSLENWSDLGASGLGVWGAIGSSAGAHLAGAFSLGYAIGDNLIAPHTTEPLSNALLKADPLGINNNSLKYPRTTRNWYDRNNKTMPLGEASDVYQGLFSKYGRDEAERFAKDYTQRADISMNKFRGKLPWYMNGGPMSGLGW